MDPSSMREEAILHWQSSDPRLAAIAQETTIPFRDDVDRDPFGALCQAIIHQQVSVAAGRTIHARFVEAIGGKVTPEAVTRAGYQAIRGAGLSNAKTSYVLDLAEHADLLRNLANLADEEVISRLTQVKGIGVWSAKMFLIFHLQRPDVCPWEDLGVRLAVSHFYGVTEKETVALMRDDLRYRWSPYASLAAKVLWAARRDEME